MKKTSLLTLGVMVAGAMAFAGTIQIPFFLDSGDNLQSDGFPGTGVATFICIKNPDPATALTITVRYFDNDGTEQTPADNTYEIPAGAAVSWRPVKSDPGSEGVGNAIGDKTGTKVAGTAIITYAGTTKVIGRVAVLSASPTTSYGYLITSD